MASTEGQMTGKTGLPMAICHDSKKGHPLPETVRLTIPGAEEQTEDRRLLPSQPPHQASCPQHEGKLESTRTLVAPTCIQVMAPVFQGGLIFLTLLKIASSDHVRSSRSLLDFAKIVQALMQSKMAAHGRTRRRGRPRIPLCPCDFTAAHSGT